MGLFSRKDDGAVERIRSAILEIDDPNLDVPLRTLGAEPRVDFRKGHAAVELVLPYPAKGSAAEFTARVGEALKSVEDVERVDVELACDVPIGAVQGKQAPLPEVRNIIAVASGKGGVGKSTTAVNLALALAAEGARVGLLDADIYGPSQPRMVGSQAQPSSQDGQSMMPVEAQGLQTMSIGYLVAEDNPMIWRGPMVTSALMQLLNETRWQGLDYLIVDMPPGTGDVQLTLAQKVPVAGAVIVTTPQDISLIDARKGLKMFEKVNVPVLGIVENMSLHVCSNCGHVEHIFGEGGGERMAAEYDVPLLGALPLDGGIREQADSGRPTVAADPEGQVAGLYRQIARRMAARLALAGGEDEGFPSIVIED